MPERLPTAPPGSNDNSGLETGRNCQDADRRSDQWRELQQRDSKQRELAESEDPSDGILRTAARARSRRLVLSQSLPFRPRYESAEFVFTDSLPGYVDPNAFCAPHEPGRELGTWLANLVPAHSDVVRVASPERGANDWNSFGCAPLIAERAFPPLPRQRWLLHRELMARMPPVIAREPNRQAPLKGKPMWEVNIAFALDIYGMNTIDAAEAVGLEDYFLYPEKTGTFLIDGKPRDKMLGSESRGGYRYLAAGRTRLSRLGGWPWCLRDSGRLPPRWYCEEEYATALATWHYQQWLAASAALINSAPRSNVLPAELREQARVAYREWYATWA
jgi:hypothetical protein